MCPQHPLDVSREPAGHDGMTRLTNLSRVGYVFAPLLVRRGIMNQKIPPNFHLESSHVVAVKNLTPYAPKTFLFPFPLSSIRLGEKQNQAHMATISMYMA